MDTATIEEQLSTEQSVELVRSQLVVIGERFEAEACFTSTAELAGSLAALEDLARTVEYLQVVGAAAAERQDIARVGESTCAVNWVIPGVDGRNSREFRDTADYLRARIRISRAEARRRLRVGRSVVPQLTATGGVCPPVFEVIAAAFKAGTIGAYAATQIRDGIERVRTSADPQALQAMEESLTAQAVESDADLLTVVIRRWESALDPDGAEPTEEALKAHQGVFVRGRRQGLQRLEIAADDEQFEYLLTVMNTATNPRIAAPPPGLSLPLRSTSSHPPGEPLGTSHDAAIGPAASLGASLGSETASDEDAPGWETRTRAQLLLDGLIGACQVALATDTLPATGGHRPQVMVTIDYRALAGQLEGRPLSEAGYRDAHERPGTNDFPVEGYSFPVDGYSVFGGPINARTVRKMACDADLIPVVLGGRGEILNLGRAQRLFGIAQRRALVARDRGCAFPDCTIPAVWTEAHHITSWLDGGATDVSNGCLLCSFHHRLIERGNWIIEVRQGIPWFIPPPYIDPTRRPRKNQHRELLLQ